MDDVVMQDLTPLGVLLSEVRMGRLSRRRFVQTVVGLGLNAPIAVHLLASAGLAQTRPTAPARRGGGGPLRLLYWQAPTILNPHLSVGVKDFAGARIFYEPLADFDPEGNLVPFLAAELPSLQNGGVAKDGTWVIWNLKKGVQWHDGRPFTADDVVFTWEFAADPAAAATSISVYKDLDRVEKLGEHSVKVVFKQPTPFWSEPFCGGAGLIPKHVFAAYRGAKSREAPANLKPVGTGPYRCLDFRAGDTVRAEMNPAYHVANRPFFDTLEMKGGGEAVSAARAVLQTGEYDFAWNVQAEDDVLKRLEQGGKGHVLVTPTSAPEFIQLNFTDPLKEVDGERSSVKAPHPFLTDPAVRTALSLVVDRATIQEQIYGRLGQVTSNFLNLPRRFQSQNLRSEFSVDRANQILDAAGWKRGADGIRARDGRRLKVLFQTSINTPRQKTQAIIKQAAAKAGIDIEIKAVVASVFFSSDPANPDTASHFYADLQMYSLFMGRPDPQRFMEGFASWQISAKENKWSLGNRSRWRNEDYDRLWRAAERELDPVKRAALFIRMNDMVVREGVVIPLLIRNEATAVSHKLRGIDITPWGSNLWNLAAWSREA
jgi:peptide/nickel transport system substrate-binding protein